MPRVVPHGGAEVSGHWLSGGVSPRHLLLRSDSQLCLLLIDIDRPSSPPQVTPPTAYR